MLIYTVFQILVLMMVANAVVYAGVFFINAEFIPSVLSDFYAKSSYILRSAICLVTFLLVGNVLFAKAFSWFDPVLVAPVNIVAFVLVQVFIGIIVSKTMPSPMIIPAIAVVTAGSYWVYALLNTSP